MEEQNLLNSYLKDNGYLSKKFIVTIASILLVCGIGVLYSIMGWTIPVYQIIADSTVTLVLGYCGISAARAAVPMAVATNGNRKAQTNNNIPLQPAPPPAEDEA